MALAALADPGANPDAPDALDALLAVLYAEYADAHTHRHARPPTPIARLLAYPPEAKRRLLDQLLCVRDPQALGPLPDGVVADVEALLRREAAARDYEVVHLEDIPRQALPSPAPTPGPSATPASAPASAAQALSFLRGDLTRLAGPLALVNPANTRMLGCFQPPHKCLDNVLHAAAGPAVRNACYAEMARLGRVELDTSEPLWTRPGVLPVSGIVHVAGPALRRGARPTAGDMDELARAYTATLDMATARDIHAVAFPCISTGVFAFPSTLAARLALAAVVQWLKSHPSKRMHILFVLWTDEDEADYKAAAAGIVPSLPFAVFAPPLRLPELVRQWAREADHIVIHAGAGLSADAVRPDLGLGLDYTSTALFSRLHPGLIHRTPLRKLYDMIGHDWGSDKHTQWGFLFAHAHTTSTWGDTPAYTDLLRLVRSKRSYTVLTSNADGLFVQAGFDAERVHTPQGAYGHFQCLEPCTPHSFFDAAAHVVAAIPHIDLRDPRIPDDRTDLIPTCPHCGGEVFFNVRGGAWFLETPYAGSEQRYEAALQRMLDEADDADGEEGPARILLLELGVGFNTPSVVRYPSEELAEAPGVRFVRVNAAYPDVPGGERAAGVRAGAAAFLRALLDADE